MWDVILVLFILLIFIILLIVLLNIYNDNLFNPSYEIYWTPKTYYEDFYIGNVNVWYIPYTNELNGVNKESKTIINKNVNDKNINNKDLNIYKDVNIDKNINNKDVNINDVNIDKDVNIGKPIILYCHGNNANISYREYVYIICRYFEYDLVLFDYEGYGKSKGKPSQSKICKNGEYVYDWILGKGYKPSQIIIWGESLGGAVAIDIASKRECSSVILFSTFSSIKSAICEHHIYSKTTKMISIIASFFINTLVSRRNIGKIKAPVLIVHSKDDDVIPLSNARDLYKHVSHKNKQIIEIEGTHAKPNMTNIQIRELYSFCVDNYNHKIKKKDITDDDLYEMYKEFRRASEDCISCGKEK